MFHSTWFLLLGWNEWQHNRALNVTNYGRNTRHVMQCVLFQLSCGELKWFLLLMERLQVVGSLLLQWWPFDVLQVNCHRESWNSNFELVEIWSTITVAVIRQIDVLIDKYMKIHKQLSSAGTKWWTWVMSSETLVWTNYYCRGGLHCSALQSEASDLHPCWAATFAWEQHCWNRVRCVRPLPKNSSGSLESPITVLELLEEFLDDFQSLWRKPSRKDLISCCGQW